jgi:hypothetical protein
MNPAATALLVLALLMPMPESSTPRVQRDVTWVSLDETMFEHLRLRQSPAGFQADGLIVRLAGDTGARFEYQVQGDAAWRLRTVRISG